MGHQKHRCGGTLQVHDVQVRTEGNGLSLVRVVQGLVCDKCKEELIDRDQMARLESSQTPDAIWFSPDILAPSSSAVSIGTRPASSDVPVPA
jgi:hypothetical protein